MPQTLRTHSNSGVYTARPAKRPLLRMLPILALCVTLIGAIADRAQALAPLERGLQATLTVYTDDGDEHFLGSAVLWRDGRIVVTNAHVVKRNSRVVLRNYMGQRVVGKVIHRDDKRDIAVIRLEGAVFGPGLEPARALPALGQEIYAVGAPLQADQTVTRGIVSSVARQVLASVPVRYIQHDAAINPGSSGGPLLDDQGRVIGINARIADGSRLFVGISYAIPAALIERAIAGDLPEVPEMGLTLRPVDGRIAESLGVPQGVGLLVDDVALSGHGARAGMQAGDILIRVNDVAIAKPGDLAFALEGRGADGIVLVVLRGGEELELRLDLHMRSLSISDNGTARGVSIINAYDIGRLGLQMAEDGVTVEVISPASPAFLAGLDVGDTVLAVNGQPATGDLLGTLKVSRPVLMLVRRPDGRTLHVVVDPWTNGQKTKIMGGANVLDPAVVIF